MLFSRDDNRRQREAAYRQELKEEINQKQSKSSIKPNQTPNQTQFSLIANIQREQEQRKRKNQNYYTELREQIEKEKQRKKQQANLQKQKELEEENKLKLEQQQIQQRYNEELRREKNKNTNANTSTQEKVEINSNANLNNTHQKGLASSTVIDHPKQIPQKRQRLHSIQTPAAYEGDNLANKAEQSFPFSLYPNRAQNETLVYLPRQRFRSSYIQELLGQRKMLEQQTSQIYQLNRVLQHEQYRKREESRGIQALRSLHRLLDLKNNEYLGFEAGSVKQKAYHPQPNSRSYNQSSLKPKPKDEWRKLD